MPSPGATEASSAAGVTGTYSTTGATGAAPTAGVNGTTSTSRAKKLPVLFG